MFVLILVFGAAQDGLFGVVLVTNAVHRDRAGVAREANARPPGGALGAARAGRARRRRPRDRGVRRRARRPARAPRRRPARRRRHRVRFRRSRDRRVAAHRRVGTDEQGGRTPRCCRAASSWPGRGASRRRASAPTRTRAASRPRPAASSSPVRSWSTGRIASCSSCSGRSLPDRDAARVQPVQGVPRHPARDRGRDRGRRRDDPRGSRAADEPRVRGRGDDAARGGACWCRSCPRWKRWRASTSSCSTRPARSPKASCASTRSNRSGTTTSSPTRSGALAADEHRNATMQALCEAFPTPTGWTRDRIGAVLVGAQVECGIVRRQGTWVLGAPEMVWVGRPADDPVRHRYELIACARPPRVAARTQRRRRSWARCCRSRSRRPRSWCSTRQIRADAADTIRYFAEQGVTCKVVSGDSPRTVGAVAARVGIPGADRPVDGRELPEDVDALGDVLETTAVIGRVTPHQKRAIVQRVAAARSCRRDDRRRCERRARAEGRRHRDRDGKRRAGDARGRADRAARRRSSRRCPESSPRAGA